MVQVKSKQRKSRRQRFELFITYSAPSHPKRLAQKNVTEDMYG